MERFEPAADAKNGMTAFRCASYNAGFDARLAGAAFDANRGDWTEGWRDADGMARELEGRR